MSRPSNTRRTWVWILPLLIGLAGCEASSARTTPVLAQEAISSAEFSSLVERISEPGGYFDTDNLISNESSYLKVIGALGGLELSGGAYVGVGPDQNYSYIAEVHPSVAFIIDVRRDNLLHHLLLKALIERAPTRLEFLAGLHGRPLPAASTGGDWAIGDIIAYLDGTSPSEVEIRAVSLDVAAAVSAYGIPISVQDRETIRRFHQTFIEAGLGLRFTTFGRPPRPYYPTYRQLVSETDVQGRPASYLASEDRYQVVRRLHLENRIIPVVGDLAGPRALREIGRVMAEMDVALTTLYASNVEFYLWNAGTFEAWLANVAELPRSDDAVLIRSYFPNFGRAHPSAVTGYYSTQMLQPVQVLMSGGFASYWDVVTRGVLDLR